MTTFFKAQLIYYETALMSGDIKRKRLNNVQNVVISTLLGMAVQLLHKDCDVIMTFCSFQSVWVVIQSYLGFNLTVIPIQVLSPRLEGFLLLKHQETIFEAVLFLQGSYRVDATASSWSAESDEAIRLLHYSMVKNPSEVNSNNER